MNAIDFTRVLLNDLESGGASVESVIRRTTEIVEAYIEANTERVSGLKLGLGDSRCGSVLIEGSYPQAIIADGQFSAYYAGFDYVDRSAVTKVGRYTIYSIDDSRVEEALSCYSEQE